MKITELRLSFIQVECLSEPLGALARPDIPLRFLLSGPEYQQQFVAAIAGQGPCQPPWREGYGKLFWKYYIQKKPAGSKDLWRALAPLKYELGDVIAADWLPGKATARAYLYPWGIGLVVDVAASGSLTLDEAVKLAFQVKLQNKYSTSIGGAGRPVALDGLFEVMLSAIRAKVYGDTVSAGQGGAMFSIVTVIDASEADAAQPPPEGLDLHKAMDGLVRWNKDWNTTTPVKLADSKIETKQAPPSHVLYGGRRGRFVWFPGSFRSAANSEHTLTCYHQNLTVGSLQTESLCRLAKDAADRLAANPSLASASVAYRNCAQLAAGLLGRLYGGTFDTYRSHSLRDQIDKVYKAEINAVRDYFNKMPPLKP
ncbi:MAG: hypothetical protein ACRD3T_03380 [Terriglobia bacterium]